MSVEYSKERKRRMAKAARKRKKAVPQAGPVTVTRADGTKAVQPPRQRGVDRPQ